MSSNEKNIPKRRFKEFLEGEAWEERKLGDITDSFSGGTPSVANQSFYNGSIPFIRSGEINENKTELFITQEGLSNSSAKLVSKGDILYALYGATSGEVGISQISGAINQAILALKPKFSYNSYFIMQWLKKEKQTIINTYLQGGQGNLSGNIVKDLYIKIPKNKDEQKLIGSFFQNIDQLITLHQRKIDKLKVLKKAYLAQMFPSVGESKPRLRFSGFNDDWEQRKLGEVSTSFEYGLNAAATEFDGKNKYIRITDINDESRDFMDDDLTSPDIDLSNADKYKLSRGDILFARTGASVGKTYIYRECDGLVYYAGFLIRAKIREQYNPEFIFQNTLTKDYEKYISITAQRSGQPGVNAQEYSQYKIMVPNRTEQDKISAYFRSIDKLITLHQRKLEKLQNIKKAYLNEMFV